MVWVGWKTYWDPEVNTSKHFKIWNDGVRNGNRNAVLNTWCNSKNIGCPTNLIMKIVF